MTPKHVIATLTGLLLLFLSFSAPAVIFEIISIEEVIEAPGIKISIAGDKKTGTISISECSKCPMKLEFDEKTRFTYKGKSVSAKKAKRHAKKDSVVAYDPEKKYAIKVTW